MPLKHKNRACTHSYGFVYGASCLLWSADSWSVYRLYCTEQAAWIKQWYGMPSLALPSSPSELTYRVNLNKFGTSFGAASLLQAQAARYSVDFTHCCCWLCWSSIKCTLCSLKGSHDLSLLFDWQAFSVRFKFTCESCYCAHHFIELQQFPTNIG